MAEETLTATVNARIPKSEYDRIMKEVRDRRRSGVWASVADVVRDALTKYFAARQAKPEGDCNGQH